MGSLGPDPAATVLIREHMLGDTSSEAVFSCDKVQD